MKNTKTKIGTAAVLFVLFFHIAKSVEKHVVYKNALSALYRLEGVFYEDIGYYNNALLYYKKALFFDMEFRNIGEEVLDLNNIADIYQNTGESDKALELYKIALALADEKDKIAIYDSIAKLEWGYYSDEDDNDDFNNALLYYKKALSLAIEFGDKEEEEKDLDDIESLYQYMDEIYKALNFFKKLLALFNEKDKGLIYNNIAQIYESGNDYEKAIGYEKKAVEIDQKFGNYNRLFWDYLTLGKYYMEETYSQVNVSKFIIALRVLVEMIKILR